MKKLGEQWVETIDGEEHMVKCVIENTFSQVISKSTTRKGKDKLWLEEELVTLDLGIINEDGLLPCPFSGEYPEIKIDETSMGTRYGVFFRSEKLSVWVGWFSLLQEAIDAWNSRV